MTHAAVLKRLLAGTRRYIVLTVNRSQNVLRALAAQLAEEKDVEARLTRPKQQQIENSRYTEALRHKLLDTMNKKSAVITPFCPCVPAR